MVAQQTDTYYDHLAIPVPCPTCGAPQGRLCTAKTKRFHNARISAGIRRAIRDDYSQHERAAAAYTSVRRNMAAGRTPNYREVNTSMACACRECLDGMYDQAKELLPWL